MIIMLFVIIGAVVCFICGFIEDGLGVGLLNACLGALIGLGLGLIVFLIGNGIVSSLPDSKKEVEELSPISLVSLKDSFGLEGGRYLFGGYFDEELKYVYVYNDPVNGMKVEKIKADDAYIKYLEDNTNPYIQPWRYHHKNEIIDHLFGGSFIKYTIYLPAGSVIEDTYQIDLE